MALGVQYVPARVLGLNRVGHRIVSLLLADGSTLAKDKLEEMRNFTGVRGPRSYQSLTDGSDAELAARRAAWVAPPPRFERGYGFMFAQHIGQADEGCDFDFLRSDFGGPTDEPAIF